MFPTRLLDLRKIKLTIIACNIIFSWKKVNTILQLHFMFDFETDNFEHYYSSQTKL